MVNNNKVKNSSDDVVIMNMKTLDDTCCGVCLCYVPEFANCICALPLPIRPKSWMIHRYAIDALLERGPEG